MKRVLLIALSATLAFSSAGPAASAPAQRAMSLNLCTDQLLLQLLPPERITSVTFLSRSATDSFLHEKALGVPVNYGTSEEVLRQNPDVVLTGNTSTPAVRELLKRIGAPLVEVPRAESFDNIRTVTRLVSRAVGEEEKGEALLAEMDATLAELARTAPSRRIVVAGWDGAGNVPAKGTLFDAILTAAGGENVASGITATMFSGRYTTFDLEQLVAMRPDILAYGSSRVGRLDLASEQLQHRVVRRLYAGRQITYPETLYSCGLPQTATAARDFRRAMLEAMAKEREAP
jgi:iron complex transport system substrate-binding protein